MKLGLPHAAKSFDFETIFLQQMQTVNEMEITFGRHIEPSLVKEM